MLKDKFITMPGLDERSLRDKKKDHVSEGELCQWLEEQLESNGLPSQQQEARCIVGILKQSRQELAQDIKDELSQYLDLLDIKKFMNEELSVDELRKLVVRHAFLLTTFIPPSIASDLTDELILKYNEMEQEIPKGILQSGFSDPNIQTMLQSPASLPEQETSYASAFPALPPKGSPTALSSGPPADSFWKQRAAHPKLSEPSSENKILVENNAAQPVPTSSRKFKSNGKENEITKSNGKGNETTRSNGKENEITPDSRKKKSKDQHVKRDGATSNYHSHRCGQTNRGSVKDWYYDRVRDHLLLMLRVKESEDRPLHSLSPYFQFSASDQTREHEQVFHESEKSVEESLRQEQPLDPEPVSHPAESELYSTKQTWDLASSCSESMQSSNSTPSSYPPLKSSATPDPSFRCAWDVVSDEGLQASPSFTVPDTAAVSFMVSDTAAVYSPLYLDASMPWVEHTSSKSSPSQHDGSDASHEILCSAPLYTSSMIASLPNTEQNPSVTHSLHLAQSIWARHSQNLDTGWPSTLQPSQNAVVSDFQSNSADLHNQQLLDFCSHQQSQHDFTTFSDFGQQNQQLEDFASHPSCSQQNHQGLVDASSRPAFLHLNQQPHFSAFHHYDLGLLFQQDFSLFGTGAQNQQHQQDSFSAAGYPDQQDLLDFPLYNLFLDGHQDQIKEDPLYRQHWFGTSVGKYKKQDDNDCLGLRNLAFGLSPVCSHGSILQQAALQRSSPIPGSHHSVFRDDLQPCTSPPILKDKSYGSPASPPTTESQLLCTCKGACNCPSAFCVNMNHDKDSDPHMFNQLSSSIQAQVPKCVLRSASDSALYPVPSEKSAFKRVRSFSFPFLAKTDQLHLTHIVPARSRSSPCLKRVYLVQDASEEQLQRLQESKVTVIKPDEFDSTPEDPDLAHLMDLQVRARDCIGGWSKESQVVPGFMCKESKHTQTTECSDPPKQVYEEKSWKELDALTEEDIFRDKQHAVARARLPGALALTCDVAAIEADQTDYNQLPIVGLQIPLDQKQFAADLEKTCLNDCLPMDPIVGLQIPADQVLFAADLENAWLNDCMLPFSIQSHRSKEKTRRPLHANKPCSFFLEGCCYRSDCKFSHDICTITCHFWEEGQCFKGDLCPFLHGYFRGPSGMEGEVDIDAAVDFPKLGKKETRLSGTPGSKKRKNKKSWLHCPRLPQGT